MSRLLIIGDVHGKLYDYESALNNNKYDFSICVGDFGFEKSYIWLEQQNIDFEKNKILFGNHDYYPNINKPYSLGDWYYYEEFGLMCIRGAFSIDKVYRTSGKDWFSEEELNFKQAMDCVNLYREVKPRIIISHDCPQYIKETCFHYYNHTPTGNLLQACWEDHRPDYWFFGHYHTSLDEHIGGTRFICLDELETYLLEV